MPLYVRIIWISIEQIFDLFFFCFDAEARQLCLPSPLIRSVGTHQHHQHPSPRCVATGGKARIALDPLGPLPALCVEALILLCTQKSVPAAAAARPALSTFFCFPKKKSFFFPSHIVRTLYPHSPVPCTVRIVHKYVSKTVSECVRPRTSTMTLGEVLRETIEEWPQVPDETYWTLVALPFVTLAACCVWLRLVWPCPEAAPKDFTPATLAQSSNNIFSEKTRLHPWQDASSR